MIAVPTIQAVIVLFPRILFQVCCNPLKSCRNGSSV